ncbi:hypothetical protein GCM10009854_40390 [Saccharopolyspora halophila]|uniref:DUF202 domain-containing protein n=1 Tax=Saccharopolyspora halophila TaxID=405551 RepID=A0ABN3GQA1_9PSEU
MHDEPWDPGLQLERTSLAWLRTALAFLAGIGIGMRILANQGSWISVLVAVGFLPLAAFLTWRAWRRHQRSEHDLRSENPLPDGILPAGFAVFACAAGCAALGYAVFAA